LSPPSRGTSSPSLVARSSIASGERKAVVIHEEAEDCAVRAAAEAVIELLFGAYPERRRFFAVEGAAGLVLATRLFQWDARTDDFRDIGAGNQLIDEGLRNEAHGCEIL
jgi:hypothetical protein